MIAAGLSTMSRNSKQHKHGHSVDINQCVSRCLYGKPVTAVLLTMDPGIQLLTIFQCRHVIKKKEKKKETVG